MANDGPFWRRRERRGQASVPPDQWVEECSDVLLPVIKALMSKTEDTGAVAVVIGRALMKAGWFEENKGFTTTGTLRLDADGNVGTDIDVTLHNSLPPGGPDDGHGTAPGPELGLSGP